MTHSDLCLIIAIILFAVVAAIRAMAKSIDGTLVAVGLAVFALAFLVT
jgi:hypothetical protein